MHSSPHDGRWKKQVESGRVYARQAQAWLPYVDVLQMGLSIRCIETRQALLCCEDAVSTTNTVATMHPLAVATVPLPVSGRVVTLSYACVG